MDDNFECPTELQFDRITDIVRSIEIVYKYQIRYKKLISDIHERVIRKWIPKRIYILEYTGTVIYLLCTTKKSSDFVIILNASISNYKNHITDSSEVDHEIVVLDLLTYASFMGIYFSCTHVRRPITLKYNIKLNITLREDSELTISQIFYMFRNSNILAIRFDCDDLDINFDEFRSVIKELPMYCECCLSTDQAE